MLYFSFNPLQTLTDAACFNIVTYVDDTILYFKWDQTFDLWKQLELASEIESDLQGTMDSDSGFLIFMLK